MAYKVDFELSKKYAEISEARPKECYSNSMRALAVVSEDIPGAKYCEGYASTSSLGGIPISHGWLEVDLHGEQTIIDVTWCQKEDVLVYEPIVKLTYSEIWKLFGRRKNLKTPVMDFYTKELIEKFNFKRMTSPDFIAMITRFHEEFNAAR